MNDELKAAAELIRNYCDDTIAEGHRLAGPTAAAKLLADAYLSAPQWRGKPTCAGLWAFPATEHSVSWCVRLHDYDIADPRLWQRPCFGPIPERPAT
jgi:hypothetical protein